MGRPAGESDIDAGLLGRAHGFGDRRRQDTGGGRFGRNDGRRGRRIAKHNAKAQLNWVHKDEQGDEIGNDQVIGAFQYAF